MDTILKIILIIFGILFTFSLVSFSVISITYCKFEKTENYPVDSGFFVEDVNKTFYISYINNGWYFVYLCEGKTDFGRFSKKIEDCPYFQIQQGKSYSDMEGLENMTIEYNPSGFEIKQKDFHCSFDF